MNFKSKSWELILAQKIKARVSYFSADLEFTNSGRYFENRPATIVSIWNGNDRYIGISQCGPKEVYSKERGREIAAGRALKAMALHIEKGHEPDDVWTINGQEVNVYGAIPETVHDEIPNGAIFDGLLVE